MKNFLSKMRSIGFRTRSFPSDDIPDGFFRIFYLDENSNVLPEKYDVELVQWKASNTSVVDYVNQQSGKIGGSLHILRGGELIHKKDSEVEAKKVYLISDARDLLPLDRPVLPQVQLDTVVNSQDIIGVFNKPNHPASAIANKFPELHDPFGHKIAVDGFIPNAYLRSLKELVVDETKLKAFRESIKAQLLGIDSLRLRIPGGSETGVEEQNLDRLFSLIASFYDMEMRNNSSLPDIINRPVELKGENVFFAQEARTKPTIMFTVPSSHSDCVLMGSEAKGIETSIEECFVQLITACGSGCLHMLRAGMSIEDAVTIGVAHAGNLIQFVGCYLMPLSFPVVVVLSPPLNAVGSQSDLVQIATWSLRCAAHCVRQVNLLDPTEEIRRLTPREIIVPTFQGNFFLKPIGCSLSQDKRLRSPMVLPDVSNRSLELNHIMFIYQRLSITQGHEQFLDLPLGVITVPYCAQNVFDRAAFMHHEELAKVLVDRVFQVRLFREKFLRADLNLAPLLVFPYLVGWESRKPDDQYHQGYAEQLELAVAFLNRARVDHQDLRPENILWRIDGNHFRLKICDFEDSVEFGEQISTKRVAHISEVNDYRYPFTKPNAGPTQYGCPRNNFYFRNCLRLWLDSNVDDFHDFAIDVVAAKNFVDSFYQAYLDPDDSVDHGFA